MFGGSADLHTGYVESLTKLTDTTLLHFCKCMYVKFYCLQITGNAYHYCCDNELVFCCPPSHVPLVMILLHLHVGFSYVLLHHYRLFWSV